MIYNDENIEIGFFEANYDYWIKIVSADLNKEIIFGFNSNKYDFNNLEINQTINLIDYLYWDTTLKTEETYYLFDITKDKVLLTKIDNNKFRLEVDIENPDMIYSPLGENATFKNIKINIVFSFS